jgi:hypothetical protein
MSLFSYAEKFTIKEIPEPNYAGYCTKKCPLFRDTGLDDRCTMDLAIIEAGAHDIIKPGPDCPRHEEGK